MDRNCSGPNYKFRRFFFIVAILIFAVILLTNAKQAGGMVNTAIDTLNNQTSPKTVIRNINPKEVDPPPIVKGLVVALIIIPLTKIAWRRRHEHHDFIKRN